MIYVYLIQSKKDQCWYTGFTDDLRKRMMEHNEGKVLSTKHRRPFLLIYYEACLSRVDAKARELFLKSGMGKRYLRNRLKHFLLLNNGDK
jgi:putative endonuclease